MDHGLSITGSHYMKFRKESANLFGLEGIR